MGPLITAVAAEVVVTDTIVDPLERDIRGPVAFVLAVESRQGRGEIEIIGPRAIGNG